MIKISPSQIATWNTCPRKWGWDKLEGVPSPTSPQAEFGTGVHSLAEAWFRDLALPLGEEREAKVARALIQKYPAPQGMYNMYTERYFTFEHPSVEGVVFHGYIDLEFRCYAFPGEVVVSDHKTTGDLVWAKTSADLLEDPQSIIYANSVYLRPEHDGLVRCRWTYVQTTGHHTTRVAEVLWQRDEAAEAFEKHIVPVARLIRAAHGMRALDLPPDVSACDRFGGCPYRENCNITPTQRLRSMMEAQSLKEKLQQRAAKKDIINAPEGPKGGAPPAPKAIDKETFGTKEVWVKEPKTKPAPTPKPDPVPANPIPLPEPEEITESVAQQLKVDPEWEQTVRDMQARAARDNLVAAKLNLVTAIAPIVMQQRPERPADEVADRVWLVANAIIKGADL